MPQNLLQEHPSRKIKKTVAGNANESGIKIKNIKMDFMNVY